MIGRMSTSGGIRSGAFCRERSLAEPLAGTATQIRRWILVEDPRPWGAKVLRDSGLAPETRAWLSQRNDEPQCRVQLIRRPGEGGAGKRKVILVEAAQQASQRRLVELELEEAEIPGLDLDALLAAASPEPALASLVLVCTHGVRDPCCAKWGVPIYEALRARAGSSRGVWQCSHLGGHRFAPTFLTLPSGLLWARTELDELDEIFAALDRGQLAQLERLRGRGVYPKPAQAAEILLRQREGLVEDEALRLIDHQALADGGQRVRFALAGGGERELLIDARALAEPTPGSCGDAAEPRSTYALRLTGR